MKEREEREIYDESHLKFPLAISNIALLYSNKVESKFGSL